jgi:hypothetical protein
MTSTIRSCQCGPLRSAYARFAVNSELTAVRSELTAVRLELTAVRLELTAVRSELSGGSHGSIYFLLLRTNHEMAAAPKINPAVDGSGIAPA